MTECSAMAGELQARIDTYEQMMNGARRKRQVPVPVPVPIVVPVTTTVTGTRTCGAARRAAARRNTATVVVSG